MRTLRCKQLLDSYINHRVHLIKLQTGQTYIPRCVGAFLLCIDLLEFSYFQYLIGMIPGYFKIDKYLWYRIRIRYFML